MRKLKLLHLEDTPADSELLCAMLEAAYDLDVVRVDSEKDFKRALEDRQIDLVISDFTLPSYGGANALELARKLRPDLPFIFFSGTLGEEAAIDALRSGATDYILKHRPQKVLAAVERALREIDERARLQEAEKALERNREGFRTLIENALDVISVLDQHGNFTFNSPSIEKILSYSPKELHGTSAFSLVHPEDLSIAEKAFGAALQRPNESITAELRVKHKSGAWRILELHGKGLLPGGPIEGVVINSRDVTEKRQTEAQLLRAQRMESLGVLAGGIAHDLNNILSPVLMGSELLKSYVPDENGLRLIDTIQASSQRGAELVKHILSFARGVKGETGMVDVKALVQEVVRLLRDTFPKSIQFQVHIQPDLPQAICNPTELHQVLMNLCVNARDAMPDGGLLQIKAAGGVWTSADQQKWNQSGNYIRVSVSDSGTGIPPEILAHIFEPFFTTKDEGKGTGLGLSTVLSIVQKNGGRIEVESTPGDGTTFHVFLQECEPKQQNEEDAIATFKGGEGQRILLVDDESAILEMTRAILENANYEVSVALDGVQALRTVMVEPKCWSLVISDAAMPIIDGPTFLAELHRIAPRVPVICTTGENSQRLLDRIRAVGVEATISKPYTSRQLLSTISRILHDDKRFGI